MEQTRRLQLLTLDQVVQALNLDEAQIEHLVATGQLPDLQIEHQRRFDERDLVRLVETYKRVQERTKNVQP